MDTINTLIARSSAFLRIRDVEPVENSISPTMLNLLIALMALIFTGLIAVAALYSIRKIRRQKAIERQRLPMHNESKVSLNNHRRLTITTAPYGRGSSIYVYDEKSAMMQPSSPTSPEGVPEIRITFPDEQDESGRRMSGRVVVVRVGETSVGLEPLKDEQLPAYEKESGEKFHSIDMDRIGGLKEKSNWS